ncbi:F-box LRR-repeat 7-like [Chlorella sorokiniana]|uniref:F-box LRR-repeat 7-like n=1 Tax=Chlorella sorokiniana TaxID=3076 RepID=A0A2P6TK65_CHLSO|nr:F-box LRR-repeat 7-like [Chlorella sorokiniana]|eukprot:PRW44466.1 F-box LRR-repeat 7-like [Chlorella sorokiniana]
MAGPHATIAIDALPDGVLQLVFSHLSLPERLRLSSVCRQWHAVSLSPALLAEVVIEPSNCRDSYLARLRGPASWLVCRAAGSVQQLTINLNTMAAPCLNEAPKQEEGAEATALVVRKLAAVGACGTLREIELSMGLGTVLPLDGWAAALCSLQRLAIVGHQGLVTFSSDLNGLTALQVLKLWNRFFDCHCGPANPNTAG